MTWWHGRRREQDLDAEIRAHLRMAEADRVAHGEALADAASAARREFGNLGLVKETTRGMWAGMWVDRFTQLTHFALRRLTRSPGFTVAVVASLGVGIAADVTMIGIADALLYRPPAHVRDVNRLVAVDLSGTRNSYPDYLALREHADAFSGVAGYARRAYAMVEQGVVTPVQALLTSRSLFATLGVRPRLGRFFLPDEDRLDGPHVAVLGYRLWQNRFGGDATVLGRTVHVAGDEYTIIGVAPEGFIGAGSAPVDLFLPLASTKFDAGRAAITSRRYSWVELVARLTRGTTVQAARADAALVYRRALAADSASSNFGASASYVAVTPLMEARRASAGVNGSVSLLLAAIATMVLLIACANVAGLLLARGVRQRHETAMRAALGASRVRLLAEAAVDGLLLSIAGGAVALLLSRLGTSTIERTLLSDAAPHIPIDPRIVAITALVTAATAVMVSVWPAWQATRGDPARSLNGAARGGTTSHLRARLALVTGQLGLTFVLVVGAELFGASLRNANDVDLGMTLDPVLVAQLNLAGAGYAPARVRAELPDLMARLAAVPGVIGVSGTGAGVLPGWMNYRYSVPGRDSFPAVRAQSGLPGYSAVTPGFFAAIGTPLVRGRDFTWSDLTRHVIIVSEPFAKLYWLHENPLGQCVKVGGSDAPCEEVIGVSAARRGGPTNAAPSPEAFVLLGSVAEPPLFLKLFPLSQIVVRTRGAAPDVAWSVQAVLQQRFPAAPIAPIRPALSLLDPVMRSWRLGADMFAAFGVMALVLAALGVYAMVAYSASQRRREVGIRLALGATARQIVRLLLTDTMRAVLVGLVLGVVAAFLGARAASTLLFGVSPAAPIIYAGGALLVIALALAAVATPAWRSTRVPPSEALREE